ncbi:MAG: PAS domain-containing protein [Paracoccaceae bacterium]
MDTHTAWDVLDQLSTFVGRLTLDGRLVSVNEAALRTADLRPEDVIGKYFWECYWWLVDEETPLKLKSEFERCVRTGNRVRYDVTVQVAGGALIVIDFQMVPVAGADGRAEYIIPSGQDITARVESERQLRRATSMMNSFFASTPLGVCVHDEEGRYLQINDALAAINGLEAEKHLNRHPTELFPGMLDDDKVFEVWTNIREGRSDAVTIEMSAKTPAHDLPRDFHVHYFPVREQGIIDGIGAIVEDVTEQKRLEALLKKTNSLLDSVLSNANLGICILDHDLRYIKINEALAEMNGLPADDHIGKRTEELFPGAVDYAMLHNLWQSILDGQIASQTIEMEAQNMPNSVLRYTRSHHFPVHTADGIEGVGVIVEDITREKQLQAERIIVANEMQHRVKNIMSTVQAISRQTARGAESVEDFNDVFQGRLSALARAHSALLSSDDGETAMLEDIIRQQVSPYAKDQVAQVTLRGANVILNYQTSRALGLALHELSTNAAKYGAFSNQDGRLSVRWRTVRRDGKTDLFVVWAEACSHVVAPPESGGFGTNLIDMSIQSSCEGSIKRKFRPNGLTVLMHVPVNMV